ncbi:acyltransferase family protein [Streptococcus hillyeri]|uniref:acyltransferase family protein n=1 Tax=Streptococcus hillyeri TaxID=2282420 RepID=UPI0034E200BB
MFMMVSGYSFARRYSSSQSLLADTLGSKQYVFKRINRIIWAYIVVFVLEMLVLTIRDGRLPQASLYLLLSGGIGPGSYYIPLLFEMIILLPMVLLLMRKQPVGGIIIITVMSFLIEWFRDVTQMPNEDYRFSLIRFVLPIELGMLYGIRQIRLTKGWVLLGILSACYILGVEYLGLESLAQPDWRSQNTLSFFYPFVWFIFIMSSNIKVNAGWLQRLLVLVSSATYHIYLVQMVYFAFGFNKLNQLLGNLVLTMTLFSVLSCVSFGILFYLLEEKIRFDVRNLLGKCKHV